MGLGELRKQLEMMVTHMRATPDPRCSGELWAEGLLSVTAPWDYCPETAEGNGDRPIYVFWVEYLEDLQDAACNLECPDLMDHFEQALDLPVYELLEASREAATIYWKGVIATWEAS